MDHIGNTENPPADEVHRRTNDAEDLRHFGYRTELRRTLGPVATFAASFMVISILVGLFSTFALGYAFTGPPVAWTVLIVLAGQCFVALVFAELAAHLPLSGSIYQWIRRVGGPRSGLVGGWVYVAAWFVLLPSVSIGLQATLTTLSPSFQMFGDKVPGIFDADFAKNAAVLGVILTVITTAVNLIGVRAVSLFATLGLIVEFVGVVLLFVVLLTHIRRGPGVAFNSLDVGAGHSWGLFGALLIGAFLPMYQLFGFDTATSLAEETIDPRHTGPRAMLRSLIVAGLLSFLATLLVPMAVRSISDPNIGSGGLQYVVTSLTSGTFGDVLLVVVVISIVCAAVTIHSLATRLVFSMARDGLLPGSHRLSSVRPTTQIPTASVLLPAVAATILLLVNLVNTKFFEAVVTVGVELAYIAYLFVTAAYTVRRARGEWKTAPGLFTLGRSGTAIGLAAVIWGAAGTIDLAWPRADYLGSLWYQKYSGILAPAVVIGAALVFAALRPKASIDAVLPEHATS